MESVTALAMMPSNYDAVRIAALVTGSFIVAIALYVGVIYFVLYFRHRRLAARDGLAPWRGLLPLHVGLIAVSYVGLCLVTMIETAARLRDDATWRSPVYTVLYLLGLWSLWSVLGHQRHRARDLNSHEHRNRHDEQ